KKLSAYLGKIHIITVHFIKITNAGFLVGSNRNLSGHHIREMAKALYRDQAEPLDHRRFSYLFLRKIQAFIAPLLCKSRDGHRPGNSLHTAVKPQFSKKNRIFKPYGRKTPIAIQNR